MLKAWWESYMTYLETENYIYSGFVIFLVFLMAIDKYLRLKKKKDKHDGNRFI